MSLPKAERIAATLAREIREGRVGRGGMIESEGALVARFGVSRNTVRRGLEMLVRDGMISTRTGVGSFVTYDGSVIDASLGWSVALTDGAGRVETRMLSIWRGACGLAKTAVGVDDCLCLDRLRVAPDGTGLSLERARLPWRAAFAPILERGLTGRSLNLTLTELGLMPAGGEETAGVLPALSATDAALMNRRAGEPMLRLSRTTRLEDGTVLEHVESILDPLRFGLRLSF